MSAAEVPDPAAAIDDLPTSFGVFKPVGRVMIGLPTEAQAEALVTAYRVAGWPDADVLRFTPRDSLAELQSMLDKAGAVAGFGYEITLLRRFVKLTLEGYRWLLVRVDDVEHAANASDIARQCGATLAVHYRLLTTEELI